MTAKIYIILISPLVRADNSSKLQESEPIAICFFFVLNLYAKSLDINETSSDDDKNSVVLVVNEVAYVV